eukprot:Skav230172  [mRNA]  locus=scaffold196:30877:39905:- [translate_table: standard]
MGHSTSTELAPGSESPSPSSLLWVKVRSASKLQTPTLVNGDNVIKIWRWLQGKSHSWHVYVTISVGRGQGETDKAHVSQADGEVCFNHTPIPFTLEDIVAHEHGVGPRANSLASMSLASTLLDRRIPEMTIKVYRVRRLCSDALVGEARLPISTTELAGTSREHTIHLENGCGSITVRCSFNCSVADLPNLQSVLAYPKRHSLAKFAQALAQLLQGEDGLELLRRALPPAIHAENSKEGTAVMQSFLVSLCNQATASFQNARSDSEVSMLSEDESDAEVMQRLAPLSRSIQDFITSRRGRGRGTYSSDADVADLTERWLCETFSLCARKAGNGQRLASMNHYMIKEFLRKGEQYPGLDHLVPIDHQGNQIQDWVNSPLPVRRDYVPHEAILGKGMFGTVWRAMDSRSGQWYAVKKSHTYRQATVAREREVTNHVLMNPHPFIVQIFGNHFIESGTGFSSLVMEFCAGGDLQDKVNAGHLLGEYYLPKEALTWLAEIFLGLDAEMHMVKHPHRNSVRPMPSDEAAELVLALTRPDPDQRLDHGKIRTTRFMTQLRLPPAEARRSQIEGWLQSRANS